ncbi:DUF4369 domain-containing protein [Pedobacter nutrimenti]|uniref:DUF4369 domain-containing protein n=1 Tax=Pedobacter nutrimenti TaxID=1241337 RepID=UPI00292E5C86|nr:DUF4369 domain-containing protein [Pedobacter nutrimenti]
MKSIPLVILGLLPLTMFAQKQQTAPYQLKGEVNFPKGDETGRKIYLVYQQNGQLKTDSALINNNKFSFNGTADIAIKTILQFTKPNTTPEPDTDPNTLILYLNKGLTDVKATGFLSRAQVTGSPVQEEYIAFTRKYSKWDRLLRSTDRRRRNLDKKDLLKLQSLNKSIDSLQNLKMNDLSAYLNESTAKPFAIESILMYLKAKGSSLDEHKIEQYFDQLPEDQKRSVYGQEAQKMIADLKKHN